MITFNNDKHNKYVIMSKILVHANITWILEANYDKDLLTSQIVSW